MLNTPRLVLNDGPCIQTILVDLSIKIPANYTILKYEVRVPINSTISYALSSVAKVEHGVVCCDSRDIKSINGLANDPYHNSWWTIKVNGNSQNYSSHSRLSPGDVVELIYSAGPISHRALKDWLLSSSKGK